jgi:hypothetical protein
MTAGEKRRTRRTRLHAWYIPEQCIGTRHGADPNPVLRGDLAGNGGRERGGAATEGCSEDQSLCESALFRVLFFDIAQGIASAQAFHAQDSRQELHFLTTGGSSFMASA